MGGVAAAVQSFVQEAPKKAKNYVGAVEADPARALLAGATGGQTELVRESGVAVQEKMREEAARNAPAMEPMPGSGGDVAAPEDKADPDASRPRGRASTILSGRRGLSGSATTARRTLLGV